MLSSILLLYSLGALDALLCVGIFVGYFTIARRKSNIKITSLREAFEYLEKRLRQAFPDLRDGFTWGEAMTRVRPLYESREEDWTLVNGILEKYQAYRYGGVDPGNVPIDDVLKLAMTLPRNKKSRN